jgi:hypothetical protein
MPAKRINSQDVAEFYERLKKNQPNKLAVTARRFEISESSVVRHIRFWWPGVKYQAEFGDDVGGGRPRWDIPDTELLNALNENGTIAKTAKVLQTTPVTLSKAVERKGIQQMWVRRSGRR